MRFLQAVDDQWRHGVRRRTDHHGSTARQYQCGAPDDSKYILGANGRYYSVQNLIYS